MDPHIAKKLRAHERAASASDPALLLDLEDPAIAALIKAGSDVAREKEALAAEARRIEAARVALAAESTLATNRRRFQSLLDRSVPTKIGTRGGVHPSSLDIEIEECESHDGDVSYIAWVPVPIYRVPVAPKDPAKRTNPFTGNPILIAGETSITLSLAEVTFTTSRTSPTNSFLPSSPMTLTGFCRLEVSPNSPEEVASRLAAMDLQGDLQRDDTHPTSLSPSDSELAGLTRPTHIRVSEGRTDSSPLAPFTPTGSSI